jgi:ABC-type branched-subunit amino acid transport system substrate-binding protein
VLTAHSWVPEAPASHVGGLGPLTKPGIPMAGAELRAGMKIAIDHINRAGGVLGRELELRFADTRGTPSAGEAVAKSLQAQGASVLLGEYHSIVADSIAAARGCEIPFICSSAVLDSVTARRSPLVFRICPPQSQGWQLFAHHILDGGYRRVVFLIEPNAYWSSGAEIIRNQLGESSSEVIEVEMGARGPCAVQESGSSPVMRPPMIASTPAVPTCPPKRLP